MTYFQTNEIFSKFLPYNILQISKFLPKIICKMKNILKQGDAKIFRYIINANIIAVGE